MSCKSNAKELAGWGRSICKHAIISQPKTTDELTSCVQPPMTIVRGNGRSYGDSALSDCVIDMCMFDGMSSVTQDECITVGAGVTLDALLQHIVPKGYFLPVVPGTKFVTVGGAIAGDIHGKNHHHKGTFCQSVQEIKVWTPNKGVIRCSQRENKDWFNATCGGMGLTGLILEAKLTLEPILSSRILHRDIKAPDLSCLMKMFEEYHHCPYSVAWIDCMTRGKHMGRGIFMCGEFVGRKEVLMTHKKPFWNYPRIGFSPLNRLSISMFNHAYYHKHIKQDELAEVLYDAFFFPLDGIHNWNRMYGPKGFLQYQFVIPKDHKATLEKIMCLITESELSPFLAVLKLFGPANENYLSFPMEGWTLAVDFKIEDDLFPFLDKLDEIVCQSGGRVYLAKDQRLSREAFATMYPKLETFKEFLKTNDIKGWGSLQSTRLGLS